MHEKDEDSFPELRMPGHPAAARRPERAAGGPQEPRSPSAHTQPQASEPEARSEAVALREHNFVSARTGQMSRVWEDEGDLRPRGVYFREGTYGATVLSRTQGPEILRLAEIVKGLADAAELCLAEDRAIHPAVRTMSHAVYQRLLQALQLAGRLS